MTHPLFKAIPRIGNIPSLMWNHCQKEGFRLTYFSFCYLLDTSLLSLL